MGPKGRRLRTWQRSRNLEIFLNKKGAAGDGSPFCFAAGRFAISDIMNAFWSP